MYEYKCVGAPERGRRGKGAKTGSDRIARALNDVIKAEAVDGWEYQRTDLIPVEEKSSLFARRREVHRAVLVFRRQTQARSQGNPTRDRSSPSTDTIHLAADRSLPAEPSVDIGRLRAGQSDP